MTLAFNIRTAEDKRDADKLRASLGQMSEFALREFLRKAATDKDAAETEVMLRVENIAKHHSEGLLSANEAIHKAVLLLEDVILRRHH